MLQLGTSWEPKRAAHDTSRSAGPRRRWPPAGHQEGVGRVTAEAGRLTEYSAKLEPMKPINEETTILVPHDQLKKKNR